MMVAHVWIVHGVVHARNHEGRLFSVHLCVTESACLFVCLCVFLCVCVCFTCTWSQRATFCCLPVCVCVCVCVCCVCVRMCVCVCVGVCEYVSLYLYMSLWHECVVNVQRRMCSLLQECSVSHKATLRCRKETYVYVERDLKNIKHEHTQSKCDNRPKDRLKEYTLQVSFHGKRPKVERDLKNIK